MMMKFRYPLALFAVLFGVGILNVSSASDEKYADQAVSLGYVANAVQALVAFGAPPAELKGDALIKTATNRNPKLLEPLADLFLNARHDGKFSSVLMCDSERKFAIAEDAGCTSAQVDIPYWSDARRPPCEFALKLGEICRTD